MLGVVVDDSCVWYDGTQRSAGSTTPTDRDACSASDTSTHTPSDTRSTHWTTVSSPSPPHDTRRRARKRTRLLLSEGENDQDDDGAVYCDRFGRPLCKNAVVKRKSRGHTKQLMDELQQLCGDQLFDATQANTVSIAAARLRELQKQEQTLSEQLRERKAVAAAAAAAVVKPRTSSSSSSPSPSPSSSAAAPKSKSSTSLTPRVPRPLPTALTPVNLGRAFANSDLPRCVLSMTGAFLDVSIKFARMAFLAPAAFVVHYPTLFHWCAAPFSYASAALSKVMSSPSPSSVRVSELRSRPFLDSTSGLIVSYSVEVMSWLTHDPIVGPCVSMVVVQCQMSEPHSSTAAYDARGLPAAGPTTTTSTSTTGIATTTSMGSSGAATVLDKRHLDKRHLLLENFAQQS